LRFAFDFNCFSIDGPYHDIMADGEVGWKC
jgi:hypothetical protein